MSNILAMFKKAFISGYATSELKVSTMLVCIVLTAIVAFYICIVYREVNKSSFYNNDFFLSLFVIAIITSAIILTIQSNIVVSLGMVGALSIVRFRTAIKSPIDLIFLFWSISAGIICGAGFTLIAALASIVVTIGIVVFKMIPAQRGSHVLVVNSSTYNEKQIIESVEKHCKVWRVRARSITDSNVNLAIEVRVNDPIALLEEVKSLQDVTLASLVEHGGEVTA